MPLRLDLPGDTGTPPYRRSSLLRRRLSSQPRRVDSTLEKYRDSEQASSHIVANPTCKVPNPTCKVPNELLDRIIELFTQGVLASTTKSTQKRTFKRSISPCTLVSKDFRFLVLRRFFYRLRFDTKDDSRALLNYLALVDANYRQQGWTAGYFWVRSLRSPAFLIPANAGHLDYLAHLKDLCVDFMHSSVILQRSCFEQLFNTLTNQVIVLNLTSLMLTSLPRIDIHVLTLIVQVLPGLTNIHISSTEGLDLDCCPDCYEESLSRIIHSPIPDVYPDATALANGFGSILAPLKDLTHLFLGVFLSQPDILDFHLIHSSNDPSTRPIAGTFETVYDCFLCERYRASTKQAELLASLVLARHLQFLKYIGWSSCFGMRLANDGQQQKDEENILEEASQNNDIDLYSKSSTSGRKEDQQFNSSTHSSKTALVIDRTGGNIKVTRVL